MKRTATNLIKLLIDKRLTIAFAESVSCGLVTHQLNTVKGTSEVLKGSIICYSEEVKIKLMKIPKKLIDEHTAESQIITDKLALNLHKLINANICAAITGLSSPGGSECASKPVGTVFYAVFFKNKLYRQRKGFRGSPLEIKRKACENFYKFIYKTLQPTL